MKKILISLSAILVVILIIIFSGKFRKTTDDTQDTYSKSIEYLNNSVDFALLFYGDDIEFREGVKYNKISNITEESININNDYIYLIINDFNSNVELTIEDVKLLKTYADSHTNFNFIYLGTDKLSLFTESGIFTDFGISDDDMSFSYVVDCGDRLTYQGIWSQNDQQYVDLNTELLESTLINTIQELVSSNE